MRKRLAVLMATSILVSAVWVVRGAGPAAAAVKVRNEGEFRRVWRDRNQTGIFLDANITLRNCRLGTPSRSSSTALTVTGNGHTIRQTCPRQGVLEQGSTGPLIFDGVTIRGGDNTRFVGSQAGGSSGGGIRDVNGPVTLKNSTVTGNTSSGYGGGIAAIGRVTLANSTVSNNTAALGAGGIGAAGGVTLTNSTVSGNVTSSGNGGGISTGRATLTYGTVVDNSAPGAANLFVDPPLAPPSSFASVVALPKGGGANCAFSPGSTTTSFGFNFSDDASCEFTKPDDVQNGGDPFLGPRANNGGPTRTQLPQAGSPLIDVIPGPLRFLPRRCGGANDQRGVNRPQGSGCDIGAVEVRPPPNP